MGHEQDKPAEEPGTDEYMPNVQRMLLQEMSRGQHAWHDFQDPTHGLSYQLSFHMGHELADSYGTLLALRKVFGDGVFLTQGGAPAVTDATIISYLERAGGTPVPDLSAEMQMRLSPAGLLDRMSTTEGETLRSRWMPTVASNPHLEMDVPIKMEKEPCYQCHLYGKELVHPEDALRALREEFGVQGAFLNRDYEPVVTEAAVRQYANRVRGHARLKPHEDPPMPDLSAHFAEQRWRPAHVLYEMTGQMWTASDRDPEGDIPLLELHSPQGKVFANPRGAKRALNDTLGGGVVTREAVTLKVPAETVAAYAEAHPSSDEWPNLKEAFALKNLKPDVPSL